MDSHSVVEGVDREWLEGQFRRDPVEHAFAWFDLTRMPERTRFVTLRRAGQPVAYLIVWLGVRDRPVVHWVSRDPDDRPLVGAMPPRPLVAIVPPRVVEWIVGRWGPVTRHPLELLEYSERAPLPEPAAGVRPLGPGDNAELKDFLLRNSDAVLAGYGPVVPGSPRSWGAFSDGQLIGVARAQVDLPEVWVIGGIYTDPLFRRRGVGRALTAAATRAAQEIGARPVLFVRSDNLAARSLYENLGYRPRTTRMWIEAAAAGPT
jgi:ribosomal protein S18 acetylase RimI-like enzyme